MLSNIILRWACGPPCVVFSSGPEGPLPLANRIKLVLIRLIIAAHAAIIVTHRARRALYLKVEWNVKWGAPHPSFNSSYAKL